MPVPNTVYVAPLFLLLSSVVYSQDKLAGKIHKAGGKEVLMSVNVRNITARRYNASDMGGNYRIPAAKGDTVIFSSAGYRPDTAIVADWMFKEADGYNIYLKPYMQYLATVTIGDQNNYQIDSLQRVKDYEWLNSPYLHRATLVDNKTWSDGVGISFSPISHFSKKETQRRRLRKRLVEEEKEYYIDFRYPRAYVARVTGLKGDSLQTFYYQYRPSYALCRRSSNQDILLYINDCFKKYMKREKI